MSNLIRVNNNDAVITELQNVILELQGIDANTDTLETELGNVVSQLTTLNAVDFATETTLGSANTTLGTISTTLTTISNAVADLDANTDAIETKLDSIITELQTLNTVDFATEAKQDDIITELTTLNTVDFATEAKQDTIITELQTLNTVDFATGTDIESIKPFGANATGTTVAQSATSVTLIASNTDRKEVVIRNNAQNNNDILYLSFVSPATTSAPITLSKGDIFIEDKYTGTIYGIWSAGGTGSALIQQVTL